MIEQPNTTLRRAMSSIQPRFRFGIVFQMTNHIKLRHNVTNPLPSLGRLVAAVPVVSFSLVINQLIKLIQPQYKTFCKWVYNCGYILSTDQSSAACHHLSTHISTQIRKKRNHRCQTLPFTHTPHLSKAGKAFHHFQKRELPMEKVRGYKE